MKKRNPNENEFRGAPYGNDPYGGNPYGGNPVYYGQGAYDGEDEEGIDLMRLVQIGLRRWKTILLVVLLMAGLAILFVKLATPIYQASALMEMSVRKPRLVKESAVIEEQGSRLDTDMIFNTRLTKFQSNSMRQRVAEQYLANHPENTNTVESLVALIEDHTDWSVQRKSYVVEVSVKSPDPEQAQELANLYADCAAHMMIEENKASSDNAVQWLKEQAKEQETALNKAEKALVAYRTDVSLDALRSSIADSFLRDDALAVMASLQRSTGQL